MPPSSVAPRRARGPAVPGIVVTGLVVVAAVVVLLVAAARSTSGGAGSEALVTTVLRRAPATTDAVPAGGQTPPGLEDGVLPDGATVFDDGLPGIAHLDADLIAALRAAAADAAEDSVTFSVHSAWRSPAYQGQLWRDAVAEHGSEAEAARWVASPERSLHVSGDAIDVGGDAARAWLADHGARYGLCRAYENEPWHFELRPGAADAGCPPLYADATEDPRLRP